MFLQQLLNGIMLGGIYGLLALNFALIFGVLRVISLAQGVFVVLAGYMSYVIIGVFPWFGLPGAIVFSVVVSSVVAYVMWRLTIRPLQSAEMPVFIATMGVALVMGRVLGRVFGPTAVPFPSIFEVSVLRVGPIRITNVQIVVLFVVAIMVVGLTYFVGRTRIGRQIRAIAENRDLARSMGVNVDFVEPFTVCLSCALASVAGVLLGIMLGGVSADQSEAWVLKGLIVCMIGGLGSFKGALITGLILGIMEIMAGSYFVPEYRDAVAFLLLVMIMLFRPNGLFGERETLER